MAPADFSRPFSARQPSALRQHVRPLLSWTILGMPAPGRLLTSPPPPQPSALHACACICTPTSPGLPLVCPRQGAC
eukprot:364949-Chlamydomonas_euryale.AAC.3